jgi:type IV pilus assembly protein PilA
MLQKLRNTNEKGFTLIELMIVIAIIGILAAIAIPNFISYRNKGYCTAAESDAKAVAGAIADFFSNPTNQTAAAQTAATLGINLSHSNTLTITHATANDPVIIAITEPTGRCPETSPYRTYIGGTIPAGWGPVPE